MICRLNREKCSYVFGCDDSRELLDVNIVIKDAHACLLELVVFFFNVCILRYVL